MILWQRYHGPWFQILLEIKRQLKSIVIICQWIPIVFECLWNTEISVGEFCNIFDMYGSIIWSIIVMLLDYESLLGWFEQCTQISNLFSISVENYENRSARRIHSDIGNVTLSVKFQRNFFSFIFFTAYWSIHLRKNKRLPYSKRVKIEIVYLYVVIYNDNTTYVTYVSIVQICNYRVSF